MSQTERIIDIIDKLCSPIPGFVTTEYLSEKYEVSTRQIRRDIAYVRDRIAEQFIALGISLEYNREGHYYYFSGEKDKIDSFYSEAIIASALINSSLDPMRKILGEDEKNTWALKKKVKFIPQVEEKVDYSVFKAISSSLELGRVIEFSYIDYSKKETKERKAEPLELINYSGIWYLRAFDLKKSEVRTFSLSRIGKDIKILKDKIKIKQVENFNELDNKGFGIFISEDKPKEYTIEFKGESAFPVSRQVWHKNQKGCWKDNDTWVLIVPANDDKELIRKILSFSGEARPISPESFVENYKRRIEGMYKAIK